MTFLLPSLHEPNRHTNLDIDGQRMIEFMNALGRNPESYELRLLVRQEIMLLKKRAEWDEFAERFGEEYAIEKLGNRPMPG